MTGRSFLLLRTHGGFAGMSDDDLMEVVPYANLLQALKLAGERAIEEQRDEWRRAAFVGWQLRSAVAGSLGGSAGNEPFGVYLRKLGLGPGASREDVASDATRARDNAEKVAAAFRARGVRRVE